MRAVWAWRRLVRTIFLVRGYGKPPCPRCGAEFRGGSPVFVCNDCGWCE